MAYEPWVWQPTGAGFVVSPSSQSIYDDYVYFSKTGKLNIVIGTSATDSGAGKLNIPIRWSSPSWTTVADKTATVPFSDPSKTDSGYAEIAISYTVQAPAKPPVVTPPVVKPPVHTPTAAQKKLAHDQAKLAKDKKALKHAKGHKKAQLKKAIKKLKKAIKEVQKDKLCLYLVLCIVLLGLAGAIYFVVKGN